MTDSTDTNPSQPKIKVLIADDDAPTRMLLRVAIANWGYEITEAKDGEEAWNALQTPNAPRLLILDWIMPKLDGVTLCQRIKKELSLHPFIILLTQQSGSTNIVTGLEAGADEFLSKPFNMIELRGRLAVGAKIIKCENQIADQETRIKNYDSTIKEIAGYINNLADTPENDTIKNTIKKKIESIVV